MNISTLNDSIGRHRWTICGLIFAATTINYLDRNVLGLLKPVLSATGVFGDDKVSELNYSRVVICFQIAYAIGLLGAGKLIDRIGTKKGYAWALIGWSIAAVGHAFGHHTWSFGFWRAALGLSESGNFPAANKTVAEWFPKKERAFATGLYNSGANVGAIVAPLTVPYIADAWGWEWAFILTGVVGFTWLGFWYKLYASPAAKLQSGKLSQAEYDFIHSDEDEQAAERADVAKVKVSWFKLLTFRQTWAFVLGKFLTDPVWWFFMFWLPSFLNGENARKAKEFMAAFPTDPNTLKVNEYLTAHPTYTGSLSNLPGVDFPGVIGWQLAVAVVYCISTVGSISGGLAAEEIDQRRHGRQQSAQARDVHHRVVPADRAARFAARRHQHLVCGAYHRHRLRRASSVVGQHLHNRFRHVPQEGGRVGHRHRRYGGRGRRYSHCLRGGTAAATF